MTSVTWEQVLAWRMRRQFIDPPGDAPAVEVARRLAGIQAQVASAAELAVAVRQAAPERGAVPKALLDDRTLVKTWAMRGTYLVPAEHRTKVSRAAGWISPVVLHEGRVAGVWEAQDGDVAVTAFGDIPAAPLKEDIDRVRPLLS
jgi:hypothetical protein